MNNEECNKWVYKQNENKLKIKRRVGEKGKIKTDANSVNDTGVEYDVDNDNINYITIYIYSYMNVDTNIDINV